MNILEVAEYTHLANKYQNHIFLRFGFVKAQIRTIYQNRHIRIIIFNNLHSTNHRTNARLQIALNHRNDSFRGRKSIQITAADSIRRADHQFNVFA